MAITLDIEINLNAEDPDNPDAVGIALDIATDEAHGYTAAIRQRLEDAGVVVKEVSVKRAS